MFSTKPNYYQSCSPLGVKIIESVPYFCPFVYSNWECFDFIDFFKLDFYSGNAFKYLWRLGVKSEEIQLDLMKSLYYLKQYQFRTTYESLMLDCCNSLILAVEKELKQYEN